MIGTVAVDRAVESFVTPEGLQRLMEKSLSAAETTEGPDSRAAVAMRAYDNFGLEWLSASSIRVKIFGEGTHTVATTAGWSATVCAGAWLTSRSPTSASVTRVGPPVLASTARPVGSGGRQANSACSSEEVRS